jgi:hypothetical protein
MSEAVRADTEPLIMRSISCGYALSAPLLNIPACLSTFISVLLGVFTTVICLVVAILV